MRQIEVMQPGSPVTIGEEIEAVVFGVMLRDKGYVQYEVAWWDGNTRNSKWLDQSEVRCVEKTGAVRIGFGNGN